MLQAGLAWFKLDKAMIMDSERILALDACCGIEINVAELCLPDTILVLKNEASKSSYRVRADTNLLSTTCALII